MFQIPLSVRYNINDALPQITETHSSSILHNNTLMILLTDCEHIQIVSIPLLAQSNEDAISIKINSIASRIKLGNEGIEIQILTKKYYYEIDFEYLKKYANEISALTENDLGCETNLSLFNAQAVDISAQQFIKRIKFGCNSENTQIFDDFILSNNKIYKRLGNEFKELKITPFFYRIQYCNVIKENIIYTTKNEIKIYDQSNNLILKKTWKPQFTFISGNYVLTVNNSFVYVYKIDFEKNDVVLFFQIDINMEIKANWKHGHYSPETNTVILSGTKQDGFVIYVDGYLFETPNLVNSFCLFKGTFLGISNSTLFFLPNDPDFDLKFSNTEIEKVKKLVDMKDEINGKETWNSDLLKEKVDLQRSFEIKSYTGEKRRVGHFLSCILYFGTRILLKKHVLNVDESFFLCIELLKFDPSVYPVYLSRSIDIDQIYKVISSDWIKLDRNLLIEMLRISFVKVDIDMEEHSAEYHFLKGKNALSKGEDDYLSDFIKSLTIGSENLIPENTMLESSIDQSLIGADHSKYSFFLSNLNNRFAVGPLLIKYGRIGDVLYLYKIGLLDDISDYEATREMLFGYNKEKSSSIKLLVQIYKRIGGDILRLVKYCDGDFTSLSEFYGLQDSNKVTNTLLFYCTESKKHIQNAIDFFIDVKENIAACKLKYFLFDKSKNATVLKDFKELIGDYVFIFKDKFIGKELVEIDSQQKIDVLSQIEENRKNMKSAKYLWTNVDEAEKYPEFEIYKNELMEFNASNK